MKRFVVAGTALVFVVSCAGGKGDNSEVVAKINGTSLTVKDIQEEMALRPEVASAFVREPGGTERFVDSIARKEMLYLEAKKQGLDKDEEIEKAVKDFEKITLINKLLEKELQEAGNITDTDIQKYYEKNTKEFMIPNKVRVSLIQVKSPDEAVQVGERLKKGEDFATVAKELSFDRKSAEKGGDLGYIKKGMLPPEIENIAMYKLKLDNIAGPIQASDGIYFLKATDVQGEILNLDQIRDLVASRLKTERQKAAYETFTQKLAKTYKVEINKEVAAKITLPVPKVPAEVKKPAEQGKAPATTAPAQTAAPAAPAATPEKK